MDDNSHSQILNCIGVYTYPISFMIPGDAPPTLSCAHGNVTWRLSAQVHRPGTFSQKLSASQEVIVIVSPGEDDTEDTENIIIERQWDLQLQYLISVSGRSFYVGGTLPIQITIMPMTKAKVHRISVILEGAGYVLRVPLNVLTNT
jgi:arrestin-related trafficking adapter 3/6